MKMNRKSFSLILVLLALCLTSLSCNLDQNDPPNQSNTVIIRDNFFDPPNLTVSVGGTVVWRHQGNAPHTVTSGTPTSNPGGLFDSGTLNRDGGFTFIFNQAGTFPYFCRVHGVNMTGSIVVR